jgi:5'-deoxy-5'-methylthioadenosine phosphorylase
MKRIAIIGGTGLTELTGFELEASLPISTPFGKPSSELLVGDYQGKHIVFLNRHGKHHTIAPHKINYRANIWALKELGVEHIIATAAVGGISENMAPGVLCVPDQIIDYSHSREQSFFSDNFTAEKHIDFSYPYTESLRQSIIEAAEQCQIDIINQGTYGVAQGPRLETAAEIKRLAQDGCSIVGMTAMPEAALARELNLDYASCAVSVNWAAGLTGGVISMQDIERSLTESQLNIKRLVTQLIVQL